MLFLIRSSSFISMSIFLHVVKILNLFAILKKFYAFG